MSVLDVSERKAYLESPYFKKHEYGDFTPFYITITVITIVGVIIFVLNILLGCCSSYSKYWNDRHTGNRWITSLWSATPHNQPPLDYTEINHAYIPKVIIHPHQEHPYEFSNIEFHSHSSEQIQFQKLPPQYSEVHKKESDI